MSPLLKIVLLVAVLFVLVNVASVDAAKVKSKEAKVSEPSKVAEKKDTATVRKSLCSGVVRSISPAAPVEDMCVEWVGAYVTVF